MKKLHDYSEKGLKISCFLVVLFMLPYIAASQDVLLGFIPLKFFFNIGFIAILLVLVCAILNRIAIIGLSLSENEKIGILNILLIIVFSLVLLTGIFLFST